MFKTREQLINEVVELADYMYQPETYEDVDEFLNGWNDEYLNKILSIDASVIYSLMNIIGSNWSKSIICNLINNYKDKPIYEMNHKQHKDGIVEGMHEYLLDQGENHKQHKDD